jgi:hypothetical protein
VNDFFDAWKITRPICGLCQYIREIDGKWKCLKNPEKEYRTFDTFYMPRCSQFEVHDYYKQGE